MSVMYLQTKTGRVAPRRRGGTCAGGPVALRETGVSRPHPWGNGRWRPRALRTSCAGVTLLEIMIAFALSVMLIGGVVALLSRTRHTYARGSALMNTQLLLESIVERLREDVRCLVRFDLAEPQRISFVAVLPEGRQRVTYEAVENTLRRTVGPADGRDSSGAGGSTTDFHSRGRIRSVAFRRQDRTLPGGGTEFDRLDLSMRLKADEAGAENVPAMTILCHFRSECCARQNPYLVE